MNQTQLDCEFCLIVRGDATADVVLDADQVLAFAPLEPAARGHILVIPKSHVPNFLDAPPDVLASVASAARVVALAAQRAFNPDAFNLITSAGEAASQTVFHLHVHVVPRWEDDRMGDIWPPTTKYLEATQEAATSLLRDAVEDVLEEFALGRSGQNSNRDDGAIERP